LITASSATAIGTLLAAQAETVDLADDAKNAVTLHLSSWWAPQPARITAVYEFIATDRGAAVRARFVSGEPDEVVQVSATSFGTCVQRGAVMDLEACVNQEHDPVDRRLYGLTSDAGGYYLYSGGQATCAAAVKPRSSVPPWEERPADFSPVDRRATSAYTFGYDLIYCDRTTAPAILAGSSLDVIAAGRIAVFLDGKWAVDCFRSRGVVLRGRVVHGITLIWTA
jgi:hypothetical protein